MGILAGRREIAFPSLRSRQVMGVKLVCNTLTTLGKVAEGVVYGNRMINMGIANQKLFYRAIDMISELASVPRDTGYVSLLCGIYGPRGEDLALSGGLDEETPESIRVHVEAATPKPNVLPRGILTAALGMDVVPELDAMLAREPSLARPITQSQSQSQSQSQ